LSRATGGRPNIRALIKHFTQPYGEAEPFHELIQTVKRNSTPRRRSKCEARSAAISIRKAVAGRIQAVTDARDRLSVVLLAPEEDTVRSLLAAMMMVFPTPPTEASGYMVDAMVLEIREPDDGEAYSLPAIAAAARELWQTLPSPPSIAQLLTCVKKHQRRLDEVFQQLCDILEAADWADDINGS
jgi:hypothetical protein